jgi:hypothetical protein
MIFSSVWVDPIGLKLGLQFSFEPAHRVNHDWRKARHEFRILVEGYSTIICQQLQVADQVN